MAWPYKCEQCGASLDAAEKCDCQECKNKDLEEESEIETEKKS